MWRLNCRSDLGRIVCPWGFPGRVERREGMERPFGAQPVLSATLRGKQRNLGGVMRSKVLFLILLVPAVLPLVSLAGDGLVALQTATPACGDDTGNIYVDCGNGTVTDNRTGLVWLTNADCFGEVTWYEAAATAGGLSDVDDNLCALESLSAALCDCGLNDGSSPGEWRLPSPREWQAMVGDALGQGDDPNCVVLPPTITTDDGNFCWTLGQVTGVIGSFSNVRSDSYWSASAVGADVDLAWVVALDTVAIAGSGTLSAGAVRWDFKGQADSRVWPVRGGQ